MEDRKQTTDAIANEIRAGRFDRIRYDKNSIDQLAFFDSKFKTLCMSIAGFPPGRAQSIALTKLEEAHAFVEKMVRDHQKAREIAARGTESI